MLEMVEITAKRALEQIQAISRLMTSVAEQIRLDAPLAYLKELVEILFRLPYTSMSYLMQG